jgi:hypothetical protein
MNNSELESYDQVVFHHKHWGHYVYAENEVSENSINIALPSAYQLLSQIYDLIDSELFWSEDKLAQDNMVHGCDQNESPYNYYFSEWLVEKGLVDDELDYFSLQAKAKRHYPKFIIETVTKLKLFDGLENFNKSQYKVFIKNFVKVVIIGHHQIESIETGSTIEMISDYLKCEEGLMTDEDSESLANTESRFDYISNEMKFKYCGGSDDLFGQTIEFIEELQDILAWPDDYTGLDEA